jgi:hypothetical protein
MNRRILAISVVGMAALVAAGVVWVLASTWGPSKSAQARLAVLEMPPPGELRILSGRKFRVFVVHTLEGDLAVLRVPVTDGVVRMPDINWWRPFTPCTDFSLDTPNGMVSRRSVFSCHDASVPEWWAPRWRWGYNGKSLAPGNSIEDIPNVAFTVSDYGIRLDVVDL